MNQITNTIMNNGPQVLITLIKYSAKFVGFSDKIVFFSLQTVHINCLNYLHYFNPFYKNINKTWISFQQEKCYEQPTGGYGVWPNTSYFDMRLGLGDNKREGFIVVNINLICHSFNSTVLFSSIKSVTSLSFFSQWSSTILSSSVARRYSSCVNNTLLCNSAWRSTIWDMLILRFRNSMSSFDKTEYAILDLLGASDAIWNCLQSGE